MPNTKPVKPTPDPADVPPEARQSARGLKKWIEERRERGVPPEGQPFEFHQACTNDESCILHDHSE